MNALFGKFRQLRENPLVEKEVRLLLPAYAVALLLAVAPIWLLGMSPLVPVENWFLVAVPLWFGALLLALSSFGREFGMNTFHLLLAQPLDRARIWQTKLTVLVCALLSVFTACMVSGAVWRCLQSAPVNPWYLDNGGLFGVAIALLVILASGLSTTLLLRQMVASFWIALLVPLAIGFAILGSGGTVAIVEVVLGLYSIIAIYWARRQFLVAEEVAWTGGEVELPRLRAKRGFSHAAKRAYRPFAALCLKELRLQQAGLLGMAGLFLLHLGIVFLRNSLRHDPDRDVLRTSLEMFGGIWLLVALLTSSLSVAEERRLRTWESSLGLPISIRFQFAVKLTLVLILNGLLCGLLVWVAEGVGAATGAGGLGSIRVSLEGDGLWAILCWFLAISLVAFYASTVSRNFMQAIVIAVFLAALLPLCWNITYNGLEIYHVFLWRASLLPALFGVPALILTLVTLALANFRHLPERLPLLIRNLGGLGICLLGIVIVTAGVYHRTWEFVSPTESAHGPARWNLSSPPHFQADPRYASAILPDGRLWQDRFAYDYGNPRPKFGGYGLIWLGGKWVDLRGSHFAPGSNWVAQAATQGEYFGLRSDGTLWVSEMSITPFERKPGAVFHPIPNAPAGLVQMGEHADWRSLVRVGEQFPEAVLLLKTNGTLWLSSTTRFANPGLRNVPPRRVGVESDWKTIMSDGRDTLYGWKTNGEAWQFSFTPRGDGRPRTRRWQFGYKPPVQLDPEVGIERRPALDRSEWRQISFPFGVRADGTLRLFDESAPEGKSEFGWFLNHGQIGDANDWAGVVYTHRILVALKTDGSLWQWDLFPGYPILQPRLSSSASRMGKHKDWIGVGSTSLGGVALAADGGIWDWSGADGWEALLAPSRKPKLIVNIFDRP